MEAIEVVGKVDEMERSSRDEGHETFGLVIHVDIRVSKELLKIGCVYMSVSA